MTASEDRPGPSLTGAGPGQATLATIRFLTELALLAVLAWAGVAVLLRVVAPGT